MIEILAPAGSAESLHAAVNTGADAVYLGLSDFSARMNAKNFTTDEFNEAAKVCRLSNVKLYLALNTLVFDDEIPALTGAVRTAAEAGADAVIIQDLGVLAIVQETAPDIKLHASTQMTITSVAGAQAAEKLGFSRVVLARELSLREIAEITRNIGIETEVFVHGALCVSVSGQCLMSAFLHDGRSSQRRSANRGQCAQPCRLNFTADSHEYALSLKELSVIDYIKELEAAGVTSIKIEGRMKRPEYVAAATNACYLARQGKPYDRRRLEAVFSRGGFTDGWLTGEVSDMRGSRGREDVLASEGTLKSLRELYNKPMKRRKIDISITIKASESILCVARCASAVIKMEFPPAEAAANRSVTREEVTAQLSKLGGTIFETGEINCEISGGLFLSASQINAIRRRVVSEITEILRG
jgi:putative protease